MIKYFCAILCVWVGVGWTASSGHFVSFNITTTPVYLYENHALPQLDIRYAIDLGSIDDTQTKAGLINLLAESLAAGTKQWSKQALAFELDNFGIQLNMSVDKETFVLSMKCLKEYLPKAVDILNQLLYFATFPTENVEQLKDEYIGSIKVQLSNPAWVANVGFKELLYKGTPYNSPIEGYPHTLRSIQVSDLRLVYQTLFQTRPALLVVVGDATPAEVIARFSPVLEQKNKPIARPPLHFSIATVNAVVKRSRPIAQSHIFIGSKGISRHDPDYFPLQITNFILGGGGFESYLMNEVREKRGLAYSVYSNFETNRYIGVFYVNLQTKNASRQEAISIVNQQMKRLKDQPVSTLSFDTAKRYLIDSFPLRVETNDQIANYGVYIGMNQLPLDYFSYYPKMIHRVKRQDVQSMAKKYFPDTYVLYVLGDLTQQK